MFGLAYGVLFSYISSASFIVQQHFGYSEMFFSFVFAFNAIGIAVASGLTMKFRKMKNAALTSTVGMAVLSGIQVASTMLSDSFAVYEFLTFGMLFFLGFIFPSATTLTMTEGRKAVGAASAVTGSIGSVFGGVVSPLVGIGDMMLTSSLIMFGCSIAATALALSGRKGVES